MSFRTKSKEQHRVNHSFREIHVDDFDSYYEYEQEKKRLKKMMKNTRRIDRFENAD